MIPLANKKNWIPFPPAKIKVISDDPIGEQEELDPDAEAEIDKQFGEAFEGQIEAKGTRVKYRYSDGSTHSILKEVRDFCYYGYMVL
jgi:hypothetical protein